MIEVCSDCGEEINENFFSSANKCENCGKSLCNNCSRDSGAGIYCKYCFDNR